MKKTQFDLMDGEVLIGSELVAMKGGLLSSLSPDTNRLYVTNQRVAFPDGRTKFSCTLSEIRCFQNGMLGATKLVLQNGTTYSFTTSSAKKVKEWLRSAGIAEE